MENKPQFPAEEVTLPSKGLLYPEDSPLRSGKIEMKYMTAREEDILTNQNYIKNGTAVDRLLKSLIITSDIKYKDLLLGDKNAIMIAARILGYGAEYEIQRTHPETDIISDATINLSQISDKELDEKLIKNGKNEFEFTLPTSKINITFKLLTEGDDKKIDRELEGLKKIKKESSEGIIRLKHIILSFNGEYDKSKIREFVDNQLLARDARSLRKKIAEIQPDVDLKHTVEDNNGDLVEVPIPIGINFFWPDVEV